MPATAIDDDIDAFMAQRRGQGASGARDESADDDVDAFMADRKAATKSEAAPLKTPTPFETTSNPSGTLTERASKLGRSVIPFRPPSFDATQIPRKVFTGGAQGPGMATEEEAANAGTIGAAPDVTLPGPHGVPIRLKQSDIEGMGKTILPGLNPDASLQGNAPIVDPERGLVAPQNLFTEAQQKQHPVLTGLGQLTEGLTTPQNLALLAGTMGFGELPAGIRATLSAGFAAQMAAGATDDATKGFEAYKRGDNAEAQRLWTLAAASTALTGMAGAHALKESGLAPKVGPEPVVPKGTISAPLAIDQYTADLTRGGRPSPVEAMPPKPPETTAPPPILQGPAQGPETNPLSREAAEVSEQQAEARAKLPPEQRPIQVIDKRRVGAGGESLTPETPATLKAQTDALAKGTNSVVYFPKGTESIPAPPEDSNVTIVKGDKPGAGTYYHDDSVTPADIRKAVKNGTYGQLLGNIQTKDEANSTGNAAAVVARGEGGGEVKASVVDNSQPEAVEAQKQALAKQFPEAKVGVETPQQVLQGRELETPQEPGGEPEMERLRRLGGGAREAIPPTPEEIEGQRERSEKAAAEQRLTEQRAVPSKVQRIPRTAPGAKPATTQQPQFSPETLEEARQELVSAHQLASSFEKPGRYFASIGQDESGNIEQSTKKGRHAGGTWYGVSSSRHLVADQFPWYGDISQGSDRIGKLIEKGKGAEYERLLGRVAESIQREKESAAPVIAEFAPKLRELSEKIDGNDQDLSESLAQIANSDGRGFKNLREYIGKKVQDAERANEFFGAIDDAAKEAREAGAAETAEHGDESRAGRGERATTNTSGLQNTEREAGSESSERTESPKSAQPENSKTLKQPALPGFESAVAEQKAGAARVQGERLGEEATRPLVNIDKAAGEMERKSPLFRGTEASPQRELIGPEVASAAVGDRIEPTGKENGKTLEVTKVGATGVYAREGDGPIKFVKNGEFQPAYTDPFAAAFHAVSEWFRRDPASVKEQAKANLREKLGESSRETEKTIEALDKAREEWNGRSRQDALGFIDAIENGRTQGLPAGDRRTAQALTAELNKARDDVRALGVGALNHFIDDYFPHIWKEPGIARDILPQIGAKKPLGGSKAFLKERTIPTVADGVAYGLEPITTNPVDLALLKVSEMRKFILSEQIKKEAVGNGNVVMAENRRDLYDQLNQRAQANGAPKGSRNNEDWAQIQRWSGHVGPNGTGDYKQAWAPREFANVLNNYLEPGLRGNKAYDILRGASDKARFAQLGLSAFHLGSEAINSTVSSNALALENLHDTLKAAGQGNFAAAKDALVRGATNLVRAPIASALDWNAGRKLAAEFLKPGQYQDYAKTADALATVNGRVRPDFQYRDQFLRAYQDASRAGNKLGMAWNGAMIALEAPTKFVMQTAMNMKLGAWHELAADTLKKAVTDNWDDATKRFELQKAYDSIENRFGQVNYDNLNLSRLSKDVLQLGVRSVGWTGGTLREGLGAFGDVGRKEFSHRVAYALALPMTVGTMGALYTWLHTGEAPTGKDFFYPRTGRTLPDGTAERVSLPSYMKDVYSYYTHPITTAENKLSPLISTAAELIQNKDYSGNKVYQEDDQTSQQIADVAKYMAKQMVPFSVRNVQQRGESGGSTGSKLERGVETALGITPANKEVSRTDAENMLARFQRDMQPVGGRTKEAAHKKESIDDVRKNFQNTGDKSVLREAVKGGKITLAQAKSIIGEEKEPYLERGVKHLDLTQTMKIWDVANNDEKNILRPALAKKATSSALAAIPQDERADTIKKLRSILVPKTQQVNPPNDLGAARLPSPFGPKRVQAAP